MSYSLIIPIYNEEKRLPQLLKELELLSYNLEVILINDGSTDETKSILDDQKLFKTLHKTKNRGKGSALISGYKIANQENIIFMDADLEISTSEIPKMIKDFEENNLDALVGTRWEKIGKFSDLHFLGNFFINVFFIPIECEVSPFWFGFFSSLNSFINFTMIWLQLFGE